MRLRPLATQAAGLVPSARSVLVLVIVVVVGGASLSALSACRQLAAYGSAIDARPIDGRPDVGKVGDAGLDVTDGARDDMLADLAGDAGFDAAGDAGPDVTDAAHDGVLGDLASDAGLDAAPLGPFGAPQALVALNTATYEDDPTLTADMLEIYFSRWVGGAGGAEIWRSSRTSVAVDWDPPKPVTELNSGSWDDTPEITPDGLTLFFASERAHTAAYGADNDIWVASRANRSSAWTAPVIVSVLNSAAADSSAAPTPDVLTLLFDSDRGGGMGGRDIYIATRSSLTQPFATPIPAPGLNGAANDQNPWIDATGRVVVFSSDRAGGLGGADLWIATRPSATAPFGTPTPLAGVNSSDDEYDPWLSADLKTLYFCSTRSGNWDLYMATRQ